MKQKIKTRKAAAKRVKITGSGKIKRYYSGQRHLLEHKKSKGKRNKRFATMINHADLKTMRRLLPGMVA